MLNYPRLASLFLVILCASAACTRGDSAEDIVTEEADRSGAEGDSAAISTIRAAVRAMLHQEPTVDYVAAEMEGVIKARTKSQALIHYDGYRALFVTPRDRVTQVTFELIEAKPSVQQLTDAFGTPREVDKGMLYEPSSGSTGRRIQILAEPVSMPADERSLVRRIVIRGARGR